MGPVEHFLRVLALWLCLCSARAFVALPTACGAGRAVGASARCSAQSRPIPGVSSSVFVEVLYSAILGGRAVLCVDTPVCACVENIRDHVIDVAFAGTWLILVS